MLLCRQPVCSSSPQDVRKGGSSSVPGCASFGAVRSAETETSKRAGAYGTASEIHQLVSRSHHRIPSSSSHGFEKKEAMDTTKKKERSPDARNFKSPPRVAYELQSTLTKELERPLQDPCPSALCTQCRQTAPLVASYCKNIS